MPASVPSSRRRTRLAHRLHRVSAEAVAVVFAFWALQVFGWPFVMVVGIFDPRPLTSSLLFTVEISLWALELTAGVGAVSAWALVQAKHNARKLDDVHDHVERATGVPRGASR